MSISNFKLLRPFKLLSLIHRVIQDDYSSAADLMGEMHGLPQKIGQHITLYKGNGLDEYFAKLCVTSKSESIHIVEILKSLHIESHDYELVAQASMGQVYRVKTENCDLAVKVRYPGLEAKIKWDLAFIKSLLVPLKLTPMRNSYLLPMTSHLRKMLLEECDYCLEAKRQKAFGQLFAEDKDIGVPDVIKYSKQAIASCWVQGKIVNDNREQIDEWFLTTYLRFILKALKNLNMLHVDPHPGNFIMNGETKRLNILDYGSIVAFSPEQAEVLLSLFLSRYTTETELVNGLVTLGVSPDVIEVYKPVLGDLVTILLEPFYTPGEYDFADWRFQYKVNTILASQPWQKPLAIPPQLLMVVRLLQGLYYYARINNLKLDWQKAAITNLN